MTVRRFARVLVVVDPRTAVEVVARARWLPLEEGARVVWFVLDADEPLDVVPLKRRWSADRADLAFVDEVARGRTADEVVARACEEDADLILLGRHASVGPLEALVGGTAGRLVQAADCAVLLVHGVSAGPYHRPLVALDLGLQAQQLVRLTAAVLGPNDAPEVHALYVYEASDLIGTNAQRADESAAMDRLRAWTEKTAPPWPIVPIVRAGGVGPTLVEEAKGRAADLIVVGAHARGPIAQVLLGSVASFVVVRAPCDVLVARPTRAERR